MNANLILTQLNNIPRPNLHIGQWHFNSRAKTFYCDNVHTKLPFAQWNFDQRLRYRDVSPCTPNELEVHQIYLDQCLDVLEISFS